MSRLHKRLVIIFCLGVLLCGVGTGVAFTEFGGLTYGGEQVLGDPDIRTENIDVEFGTGEDACKVWSVNIRNYVVQVDNSVPKDTVRFCVTYNAERVEPFAYWSDKEGVVLSWCWKDCDDEMALMMEAKDVMLRNLKEGRLVSFDTPDMENVTVLVNAENEADVRMMH